MKLIKTSRVILLLTIVLVLSVVVPKYYWKMFEKKPRVPSYIYSSKIHDFISMNVINKSIHWLDNKGVELPRKKFEQMAPLYYYRTLMYHSSMPDTINGWKVDIEKIKFNTIFTSIKPEDIQTPMIHLAPLLESKPDGPKLNMPKDFFRITDRMEFINCESNSVEEAMSKLFTDALVKAGFTFPAKNFWGNPSTMKPYDDGYFILDSADKLFHMKKVHGKPVVRKINMPNGVTPVFISVTEIRLREFHAIVVTEKSEVYLISFDNYKFIKLPLKEYNYRTMQLRMNGNVFTRTFTLLDDNSENIIVTNRNYEQIAVKKYSWIDKWDTESGEIFNALFPFTISLTNENSTFVNFYFTFAGWITLIGIIGSLIFYFFYNMRKKDEKSNCLFDFVLIAFTGIYGLIAVLLIKDESWKV
jgi:hypothetical protein